MRETEIEGVCERESERERQRDREVSEECV